MNRKILFIGGAALVGYYFYTQRGLTNGSMLATGDSDGMLVSGTYSQRGGRVTVRSLPRGSQASRFASAQRARNIARTRGTAATITNSGTVVMTATNGGSPAFDVKPHPTSGAGAVKISDPRYQPHFVSLSAGGSTSLEFEVPAGRYAPTLVPPSDGRAAPEYQRISFSIADVKFEGDAMFGGTFGGSEFAFSHPGGALTFNLTMTKGGVIGFQLQNA